MEKSIHGGDIYRNRVKMDFSVNVNPLGINNKIKSAINNSSGKCLCYPDPESVELRNAIGRMLKRNPREILCGNGASELFLAIVHAIRPKRVVIPVPSFYGYEYAAEAAEAEVSYVPMKPEEGFQITERFCGELEHILNEETDLFFLANPNNPVGSEVPPELLQRILEYCRKRNIYVVLDECFMEFTRSGVSMVSQFDAYSNLFIVRAFTKIYAIPGIRLGYLLCSNEVLRERIRHQLPEWNLSVIAQEAGAAACEEWEYRRKTPDFVAAEREYLLKGMKSIQKRCLPDLKIFPSQANFLMFYTEFPLYEALLQRGILIRDCRNYRGLGPGYYRIAVKSREENEELLHEWNRICIAAGN